MPKTRQVKEQTVLNFTQKLEKAKSVVLTDYQGLTMANLSDLRNKIAPLNAEFTITKNSLMALALKAKNQSLTAALEGQTATLFAYDDEISPIKILVKTFKDLSKGKIKGGLLGNQTLDAVRITQLSQLPSKEELQAKIVGVLAAPLQGMVGVLQANLRNLLYTISEIQKVRGGV